MVCIYFAGLRGAEYRERVGFQAEFNWDMGKRVYAQGRQGLSPRRSPETRERQCSHGTLCLAKSFNSPPLSHE